MPLSMEDRIRAVVWDEEGVSQREIANRLHCSQPAISKLLQKHTHTGSVLDLPRSGRPRISTPHEDATLIQRSLQHRRHTARQLRVYWEGHGVNTSTRTVQRRLRDAGLLSRIAVPKPLLTETHKLQRLQFALNHQHWTTATFARVIFTDEAPMFIGSSGGRVWVRLRRGEHDIPEAQVIPRQRRGSHILVWGAIQRSGVGPLIRIEGTVNAERYLQILQEVIPQMRLNQNSLYMHDNAPSHRAAVVQDYFLTHNIHLLPWPSNSPDLNPIENVWGFITQNIDRTGIKTSEQLWARVQQCWNGITAQQCQHLIDSMPGRLQEVIHRDGGSINY